jgi:phage terminase Nu1 subunit (DNA packaging protein)
MSQLVNQAEFARMQGVDKAHITRLKAAGRLVMVERDGKPLVDVEASRAKIAETADPAHESAQTGGKAGGKGGNTHSVTYNEARARNELAKAELAEMERDKQRGSLVDAEAVRLFAADLGASFRGALEILPDRLAPELVPLNDAEAVRAVLVENFEQLLHDLMMKIEKGVAA